MKSALPVLLCSVVALLLGVGSGLLGGATSSKNASMLEGAIVQPSAAVEQGAAIRELKPIVTNLSAPAGAWIRLELALALNARPGAPIDKQIAEFASDTADFLRSLSAEQLQGPNGLRRLREDLLERARFRVGKEAESVLIQTLVIQ
ncbi:MAG: flagellar basal body-associated FliL family protein [Rhodoblastus sp.]